MDAVKFIEERDRMCKAYYDTEKGYCADECPAHDIQCTDLDGLTDEAKELVKAVEKWSAAHPRKTRQDVFLEQWPEARIYANGALSICPNAVCAWRCGKDGERVEETGTCDDCCREFWSQEVE